MKTECMQGASDSPSAQHLSLPEMTPTSFGELFLPLRAQQVPFSPDCSSSQLRWARDPPVACLVQPLLRKSASWSWRKGFISLEARAADSVAGGGHISR